MSVTSGFMDVWDQQSTFRDKQMKKYCIYEQKGFRISDLIGGTGKERSKPMLLAHNHGQLLYPVIYKFMNF